MGAIQIDNNNIYESIIYILEKTEVDSFAKTMADMQETLKKAEEIRYKYSASFGQMIYESGSIILTQPNLRRSLKGLLFQVARDHTIEIFKGGEKSDFKFLETPPFIAIDTTPSPYVESTFNAIKNYCRACEHLETLLESTTTETKNILSRFNNEMPKWEKLHDEHYLKDKTKMKYFEEVCERNINKIKHSIAVLEFISAQTSEWRKQGKEFFEISRSPKLISKELDRALRIRIQVDPNSTTSDNRKLYYQFSTADKHKDPDHWKKVYFTNIKINKIFTNEDNKGDIMELKKTKILTEASPETQKNPSSLQATNIEDGNLKENNKHLPQTKKKSFIFIHSYLPIRTKYFTLNLTFDQINSYVTYSSVDLDNRHLVVGLKNGEINVFDYVTSKLVTSQQIHKGSVSSVCYLNDGKTFLSGGKDGIICKFEIIKDVLSVTDKSQFSGNAISALINIFNGKDVYLAMGKEVKRLKIHSFPESERTMEFDEEISLMAFLKEQNILAVAFNNGGIEVVRMTNKERIFKKQDQNLVTHMEFCKLQNMCYLVFSYGNTVDFLRVDLMELSTFQITGNFVITKLQYCHDDKNFVLALNNGNCILWNYHTSKYKDFMVNQYNSKIKSLEYLGDGVNFITAFKNGKIELYTAKVN